MNAFDSALSAIFRDPHLSKSAIYTPAGGAPMPIRIVFNEPDAQISGSIGQAPATASRFAADMLVSQVPAKPDRQCRLQVEGVTYKVSSSTQERGGRIWRAILASG